MNSTLKKIAKRLRAWPPFNGPATSFARGITRAIGWRPEFLARHLHRVGDVSCPLPNGRTLRLWSRGDDWVSNQIFWYGLKGYEPETIPLFARLAASARVTLDVGSYVGFYSLIAGHANPAGHVHAFEPMMNIFARLQKNIALNDLQNVSVHHSAVGDESGAASFYFLPETELPTSSSLSSTYTDSAAPLQSITVPVITLDDFLANRNIADVDLMKIDTETTEPAVLRGAKEMLARNHPHIVCEVLAGKETGRELQTILAPLGYRYYLLTNAGPIESQSIDGDPTYLNYLFTTLSYEDVRNLWR